MFSLSAVSPSMEADGAGEMSSTGDGTRKEKLPLENVLILRGRFSFSELIAWTCHLYEPWTNVPREISFSVVL